MKTTALEKAIKGSADPGRAGRSLEALAATEAGEVIRGFSEEIMRVLVALLSGSQALTASLVAHPAWLKLLDTEWLKYPRRKQGLAGELNAILQPLATAARLRGSASARPRIQGSRTVANRCA